MKQVGIYVHIPFCKSKCQYCDFISFSGKQNLIDEYIECLRFEIREVGQGIKLDIQNKYVDNVEVATIYIGGGTPSYIDSKYIVQIMKDIYTNFKVKSDAEITIEVNPGTVDKHKLLAYKEAGINRLSIGLQSVNNELLKMLGRIHTYEEFVETYKNAREVGFENINIDFIIGLPNQTMNNIVELIETVEELRPEHISVYSLIVEEGTKIEEKIQNKELELPAEELEREMYWAVKEKLEKLMFNHYEISNFALKGKEAKHNLDCWNQKEYIGFGVAAHSYSDDARFSNIDEMEEYIKNTKENKLENNFVFHEKQDKASKMKEYMLLGLRKLRGISCSEFETKFGKDVFEEFGNEIEKLMKQELIEIEEDYIKLSNKGIDLANLVWEEFV